MKETWGATFGLDHCFLICFMFLFCFLHVFLFSHSRTVLRPPEYFWGVVSDNNMFFQRIASSSKKKISAKGFSDKYDPLSHNSILVK